MYSLLSVDLTESPILASAIYELLAAPTNDESELNSKAHVVSSLLIIHHPLAVLLSVDFYLSSIWNIAVDL